MSDAQQPIPHAPAPAATVVHVPPAASLSPTAPAAVPVVPAAAPAAAPAAPIAAQPPAQPPPAAAPPVDPPRNPYARKVPANAAPRIAEASRVATLEAQIAAQNATLGAFVDAELTALPAAMQSAVREGAGEDVNARMRMIAALKKHGALAAPAAPVTGIPSQSTSPNPLTAPGAAPVQDADAAALARLEKLRSANAHHAAAEFMAQNRAAILRAQAKRANAPS